MSNSLVRALGYWLWIAHRYGGATSTLTLVRAARFCQFRLPMRRRDRPRLQLAPFGSAAVGSKAWPRVGRGRRGLGARFRLAAPGGVLVCEARQELQLLEAEVA